MADKMKNGLVDGIFPIGLLWVCVAEVLPTNGRIWDIDVED